MSSSNHVKVLVVGAGVTGLAAAKTLTASNIPFILADAQNYVGGRVCTVEAGRENSLIHFLFKFIGFFAKQCPMYS